jgi:tRNA(Ile2) C34 agmatinyltransferase TiaS
MTAPFNPTELARKVLCPGSGMSPHESDGSWGYRCPVCLWKMPTRARRPHRVTNHKRSASRSITEAERGGVK